MEIDNLVSTSVVKDNVNNIGCEDDVRILKPNRLEGEIKLEEVVIFLCFNSFCCYATLINFE